MNNIYIFAASLLFAATSTQSFAANLHKTAEKKIETLEKIISTAKKSGINTLKEQTTVRTAEIFLVYAAWDAKNIETNTKHFALAHRYKDEAERYARELADWERNDIIKMLDSSIEELNAVIAGDIKRLDTPNIDWSKVSVEGDELIYKGRPVFLTDWTWKPRIKKYCEYHGSQDGYFISPTFLLDENGTVQPHIINELKEKPDGDIGFVFINHSAAPKWAIEKDPTITDGPGEKYTAYDINNPLSLKIQQDLFAATVPLMAGKKYTELGYMLCNEPHWNTIKGEWTANPISEYAYKEFLRWLERRHGNIETLNSIWGASYGSFAEIDVPRIREAKEQGTPLYFDFLKFNMDRVNDWFGFLSDEVKRHDPAAKTQIKIMPNLWSDGKRDSGIDMESIIRNTDIIGNDASSCGAWMWGKPHKWEANYSYDWREICMAYDFFKSISPNKVMYNTEGHMLSTNKYRDLNQTTEYARNNYWLAHIHGLTAMQTWYWARREDGSCREHFDANGYAASNNHQPRIVNEVHTTMLDLNSVSEDIMAFQRQRKPIRIFYTEASAINSKLYIEDIFDTYESLFFEGTPIGFATAGIIELNDNSQWDVVALSKTPRMFEADVEALQSFVDRGGIVVKDSESMLTNEYGLPLKNTLKSSRGAVIEVSSLNDLKAESFKVVAANNQLPEIEIVDNNGLSQKGCTWRVIEGKDGKLLLNLVNLSKNPSTITVKWRDTGKEVSKMVNKLTGESVANNLTLIRDGIYLLEIER
ncbi:MAG: beta-galactosidase [Rikenellaceae bacterium]